MGNQDSSIENWPSVQQRLLVSDPMTDIRLDLHQLLLRLGPLLRHDLL